ncbi:hypothetical protein [Sporosarcina sp.]|uniref:hypothetical protein n=1 Tax=Sporosarcina sp. TaxID=49982 RepID=UPI00261B4793|nr:hypothetical protein [Sporosarcina sp.]
MEEIADDDGFDKLPIGDDTMLVVLQMFGNDDLAFIVVNETEEIRRPAGEIRCRPSYF